MMTHLKAIPLQEQDHSGGGRRRGAVRLSIGNEADHVAAGLGGRDLPFPRSSLAQLAHVAPDVEIAFGDEVVVDCGVHCEKSLGG